MKKINLLTCLFFLLNITVYSQFKNGYIVKNNNDTIYGYIDFEGSIKNSEHCSFKLSEDSAISVYYPEDIKAFRFTDSKYFSTFEIITNNVQKKVFLEWLIKGKASILIYTPDIKSRYYILLENDSLYELKNTEQFIKKNDAVFKSNKEEYKGALRYYFNDCPSISGQINNTAFTGNSLIKVAKTYHKKTCHNSEECIVFEDKNRKLKYSPGIIFSQVSSQLKLNNNLPGNVNISRSVGLGFTLNISNLPLISSKFSLGTQIMYSQLFYTYHFITDEKPYWFEDNRMFKFNYLRMPFQLKYKFLYNKFTPFISLGLTANMRFHYTQYDRLIMNYITKQFADYTYGIKPIQYGINTGIGFLYTINPKYLLNIAIEYEHDYKLFRTFVTDQSFINNYIIQLSFYYNLN